MYCNFVFIVSGQHVKNCSLIFRVAPATIVTQRQSVICHCRLTTRVDTTKIPMHIPGNTYPNWYLITKTCLFKYTENFTTKKWKKSNKNSDIFHISAQNIDCRYSLEPPRRGGSNEYQLSMVLSRNKKTNVYPCKHHFYCIKVGFKGVKIIQVCFRDVISSIIFRTRFSQLQFFNMPEAPKKMTPIWKHLHTRNHLFFFLFLICLHTLYFYYYYLWWIEAVWIWQSRTDLQICVLSAIVN